MPLAGNNPGYSIQLRRLVRLRRLDYLTGLRTRNHALEIVLLDPLGLALMAFGFALSATVFLILLFLFAQLFPTPFLHHQFRSGSELPTG